MADDVLRHLHVGFIRLHVLYHANQEPICGVELMEELERHGYDVGPGTIYPILHQMESAGLIVGKEDVVNGKRRKNFRASPAGKKLLAQARIKLRELASEILEDRDARKKRRAK
jgi:PadR family transcriptional regulator, regulatory protein PadR